MIRKLLSGLALTVAVASVGQAQDAAAAVRPITFGIKAGAALPMGDFGDAAKVGYLVGGHVGYATPTLPVSFRLDLDFSRYGSKAADDMEDVDGNFRDIGVVANVLYDIKMQGSSITPYIIGGVGIHSIKASLSAEDEGTDVEISSSETKFGIGAGAGVKIPLSGFSTFIEARYKHIFTEGSSIQSIPIYFGISF